MKIAALNTEIQIGNYQANRCPRVWIAGTRNAPLTRYGVTLPDPAGDLYRSIRKGDLAAIRIGYRDEGAALWEGTVDWKSRGTTQDQIEVGIAGQDLPFSNTIITQSWENESPEAIVKWAIAQAGMTAGRIDSPGVIFPRFSAPEIPVWQVARQCAYTCLYAFGIDMNGWAFWLGADNKVNWGNFDEDGDMPVIATGAGLIRHLPSETKTGLSEIETFLLADFRHSMRFRLIDERRGMDTEFRALGVLHDIKPDQARTYLRYGEEHAGF
ncbi:MAG: hypothetical protein ABIK15_07330 [Pseudomonadota bacterium]